MHPTEEQWLSPYLERGMVRIVCRFAIGSETYVVTLNAWPNVDILVKLVEVRNTYPLTKESLVLTGVNHHKPSTALK